MQTLFCPKNKNMNIHLNTDKNQQGFSLIECILAIGILSVVIASFVGLQSSIISVTQIASDSMRASWATHSAISQMQYLIETQGQSNVPEESNFPWITDNQYSIKVTRKDRIVMFRIVK